MGQLQATVVLSCFVRFKKIIISLLLFLIACVNKAGPVQCLDGCSMSPALLGQDPTIGGCCGLQGRNGGGFLLADASVCINCTNFRSKLSIYWHHKIFKLKVLVWNVVTPL